MNEVVEEALRDAESELFRAQHSKSELDFAVHVDSLLLKIREALLGYGGLNADSYPRLRVLMVLG